MPQLRQANAVNLSAAPIEVFNSFTQSEKSMTATTKLTEPNGKLSLVIESPYIDERASSNKLDTTTDSVISRYMSNSEASPCLFFSSGMITPQWKADGTRECFDIALNNKHR
jgi:hypothetical protein